MDDLKQVLGEQLMRFVLAYDLPVLDESRLNAEQVNVVGVLRKLITASANEKIMGRTVGLGNALLVYLRDRQMTAANTSRLECGGTLPELRWPPSTSWCC